jgi:hypothetical protein
VSDFACAIFGALSVANKYTCTSVFSFAALGDLFLLLQNLPEINDLATRQRKVQFSLPVFT